MRHDDMKAKASEWNDLQVLAYDAEQAGETTSAAEYLAKALVIECELQAAGTDIRALVCP